MARSCNSRKAAKIALCISTAVLILSLAMFFVFNAIYNHILKKDITLGDGSLVSKIWEDIPLPIYERLYFFNITNTEEFLKGERLNVTEIGPYAYKARWVKPNPEWHPNNTVSYREVRTYQFVPEMSNGTQDDVIYTLNAPMIIASNLVKDWPFYARAGMSVFFTLEGETLIIKKSIRELVYEGYEDVIIKDAPYIKKDIPYKDGKFSWLYGKNDTDDGLFTVFTGVDDASKTNFIKSWNEEEKLSFWKGDPCNELKGTSIETGPPIDGNIESYTFFQSIFCRSLTFNYDQETTHYDITSKRFRPTRGQLANGTENPENQCFEVNKEYASGVLDVSPCQFGAPVFISFPHFHLADTSFLSVINGLDPKDTEHGSYIDVEPITGLSIDLAVRFQINIEVSKVSDIGQFRDAKSGIYPVFWVELSLQLDEKMADFLKSNVRKPKLIAYSVLISLCCVSLIVIIASAIVLASRFKKNDDSDLLIKNPKVQSPHNTGTTPNGHVYDDFPAKHINASGEYIINTNTSSVADFARDSLEICKETPNKSAEQIYPSI